jgi:hypothetical protein
MELGQPRRDPAVAALEARLGWPAVMAEGCRWIIGKPGKGAWKWCGAPCIDAGRAAGTTWCAHHWRLVYLIGGSGVDSDQPIRGGPRSKGGGEPSEERSVPPDNSRLARPDHHPLWVPRDDSSENPTAGDA